jgi:endo-1,3(4)-beta-glucanase
VRDHNYNHFPPILQKYGAVGQIAEDDFYVYTLDWPCAPNMFPMRHGCLVGIQIIPITAVSKYWMDKVIYKYYRKYNLKLKTQINKR